MMPAVALVGIPGPRWVPPLPLPLFLLWPALPLGLGFAKFIAWRRPTQAEKIRIGLQVFRELRGLSIDVKTADNERVRIWFA